MANTEETQDKAVSLRDMPVASIEDILNGSELISGKEVLVPRWGKVIIREVSAMEQLQARKDSMVNGVLDVALLNKALIKAALVKPALTDGYIDKIMAGSSEPLNVLIQEIVKLNLIGSEGEAAADANFPRG